MHLSFSVIDRRIREKNVFSDILPLSTTAVEILKTGQYKGIIISGGPNSVYDGNAPIFDSQIFHCGLPILGICYGFQLINKVFNGGVAKDRLREDGQSIVNVDSNCRLFQGLSRTERVLLTHGDSVTTSTIAPGFEISATSGDFVAGISNEKLRIYGVQFHPEVDLTENGSVIFNNFLYKIVGCSGLYTISNREQMCIEQIRNTVGRQKVLVMVSGGVDSTVCSALLHKALGPNKVIAIHIDNGFMRENESSAVQISLNALDPPLNVHVYKSRLVFMHGQVEMDGKKTDQLCLVVDPENKRRIIGDTFMEIKDQAMNDLNLSSEVFLAQGTLRPDLIESASHIASSHADVIKTHHNDTALVRELRDLGKVIEPLKDFHKDEVRQLGRTLNLPPIIVDRHPFPGPGLAIRIICALRPYICSDFKNTQRKLTAIVQFAQCREGNYGQEIEACLSISESSELQEITNKMAFNATLLPIKTVGVQGDQRSYSYVAAISTDSPAISWQNLGEIARIIPKLVHNINRVVYLFGNAVKLPIYDITPTLLNEITISQVQKADTVVQLMVDRVLEETPMISRVLLDLTSKPPGTTEWE